MSMTFKISNQDVHTKQTNQKSSQTKRQHCCDPQCSSFSHKFDSKELFLRYCIIELRKMEITENYFPKKGEVHVSSEISDPKTWHAHSRMQTWQVPPPPPPPPPPRGIYTRSDPFGTRTKFVLISLGFIQR